MQVPMGEGSAVRMAGYLEKRGKLKLMSSWKKYWFVLEGQLLLYYKSQLEYINLSACRGSLNIGLASCVRPGQGLTLQVVTRTQCVTLRTKERSLQEQWLQALLDSMALPNTSTLKRNTTGTQHFRYSLDNLPAITESDECSSRDGDEKKSTLPRSVNRQNSVLQRIQRMGGVSYNTPQLATNSHTKLSKSASVPTVQGDVHPSDSSKEVFLNNLMAIRDLLEETSKKNQEATRESPDPSVAGESSRVSAEYSELVLNEPLQDENTSQDTKSGETKLYQMSENNYCYERLQNRKPDDEEEEEVEYTSYDRVALMKDLMQAEDVEPDLPPRPVKEFAEYEELNLAQSGTEKKNLRDIILKFKDQRQTKVLKKSTSQELQVEGGKKKRKNSFLNKIVLRLKRKESAEELQAERKEMTEESDEEPIYESVTFEPHPETEPEQPPELPEQPPELPEQPPELPLEKNKKTPDQQLPANTIQELKDRMRLKSQETTFNYEDNEDYYTISSTTSGEQIAEKLDPSEVTSKEHTNAKSRETSTENVNNTEKTEESSKTNPEHVYAKSKKHTKTKKSPESALEVPSLPPRRMNRPTSPWHDIPTNNSPVDPLVPVLTSQSESSNFTSIPDNILNTPQGFQLIKNQWRQAEKIAFPNKTRERITSPSESNHHSLESLTNTSNSNCLLHGKVIPSIARDFDSLEKVNTDSEPFITERLIHKESHEIDLEFKAISPCFLLNQPNGGKVTLRPAKKESELIDDDLELKVENRSHDLIDLGNGEKVVDIARIVDPHAQTSDMQVLNIMDASIDEKIESLVDTDEEIVGINRYSDELHLLLTQLAEITSAPLFHIGATKSLITTSNTISALDMELGPIRRRRHSDPDYDVPRPHQSLFARDTPDISMSPDSLEPALEHFLADVC